MMKKFLTATAVMMALFSATSVKAAYISDPTFETPAQAAGTYSAYAPSSPYWTFTGYSAVAADNSGFGNTATGLGAPNQTAILQYYHGSNSGVITQAITTAPAGTYTLSFLAENRSGTAQSSFSVTVGSLTETFTPTTSGSYTLYTSNTFTISGATTLTFTALGSGATDSTSFITNVSLNAVPEPASVGMLGLGLIASAGFAVRKARRNRA